MSEQIIIYHNGECSKSKGALELLQEHNIPHQVRWYLAEPLSKEELKMLLNKLSLSAEQIVRKNEALYKQELEGKAMSEDEWLDMLVAHPVLIERPIVETGDRAIIARPPEKVLEFIR